MSRPPLYIMFYGVQAPAWFNIYDAGTKTVTVGVAVTVNVSGFMNVTAKLKSASTK